MDNYKLTSTEIFILEKTATFFFVYGCKSVHRHFPMDTLIFQYLTRKPKRTLRKQLSIEEHPLYKAYENGDEEARKAFDQAEESIRKAAVRLEEWGLVAIQEDMDHIEITPEGTQYFRKQRSWLQNIVEHPLAVGIVCAIIGAIVGVLGTFFLR